MYKNRDSQTALGRGYVDNNSAKTNTGGANAKGMCFGETTGKQQVKFLGVEDFWGNVWEWTDGIWHSTGREIRTDFGNFTDADEGSSYRFKQSSGLTADSKGHLKTIQGTNEGCFLPNATTYGSATTFWADAAYLFASYTAYVGGRWNNGALAGAFRCYVAASPGYSSPYIGTRLIFKQKSR